MARAGRILTWKSTTSQLSSRALVVENPDGTSSRPDQMCLDVAPAGYEVEKSFWTALTGGNLHAGARAEVDLLKPSPGLPIRILAQRIGTPAPSPRTPAPGMPIRILAQLLGTDRASSAHVGLACSDIEAPRSWHEQRDARVVGRWPH